MLARRLTRIPLKSGLTSKSIQSTASLSTISRVSAVLASGGSGETTLSTSNRISLNNITLHRSYATSTLKFKQASISEDEYHEVADTCLDSLTDSLEQLVEAYDGPDADDYEAEYSVGVTLSACNFYLSILTLRL